MRSQTDQIFEVGNNLAKLLLDNCKELSVLDQADFKRALLFFFCKAYKTYKGVQILWKKGFEEDALTLTRTIFEISLQAQYMEKDPNPRAQLWVDHDVYMRCRHYIKLENQYRNDPILGTELKDINQDMQKLKDRYEEIKENYSGVNWWGNTVKWLASELGEEMQKLYDLLYWILSRMVHSSVTSVNDYVKEEGDGLHFNCGPSISDNALIPIEATKFLLNILQITDKAFGFTIDHEIEEGVKQIKDLSEACA